MLTDAPICQDTRSGGLDDRLASAEIGHDALVDLASEDTFQAPDDLSRGSAVRRAACDVINGRLMVPHADDDGSIEGIVKLTLRPAQCRDEHSPAPLPSASLSARNHQPCRLALPQILPELPGC